MSHLREADAMLATVFTSPRISLRRLIVVIAVILVPTSTVFLLWGKLTSPLHPSGTPKDFPDLYGDVVPPPQIQVAFPKYLRPETYLGGPPTAHFRDGLRNDTPYVTSWLSAGWTNDVMTIGNLIYLALITSRVPVLPPFTSHIGGSSVPIAFSEIFDIQRLSIALNLPILEWHQIKHIELAESLKEQDELGCWNIWEVNNIRAGGPRGSYSTLQLNLDISYTRAPHWVKLIPGFQHDSHSTFWSLARLAFPSTRNEVLADPVSHPTRPSEQHGTIIPPDEQMLCYDYLYYVCGNQPFEYEYDYSPAWRFVVQHFRWTSQLENLALGYVRRTLRIPDGQAIPPYITIHARRGDFAEWCGDIPVEDCFAPLSAFVRRVAEVQQDLRERHGIEVSHVIMTGDEKDESWRNTVHELGWSRVDHNAERTVQLHGKWYPVILDAVIQSLGVGFVGTDRSTFSILARRRVVDWNDGAIRTMKWGRPDSDAH